MDSLTDIMDSLTEEEKHKYLQRYLKKKEYCKEYYKKYQKEHRENFNKNSKKYYEKMKQNEEKYSAYKEKQQIYNANKKIEKENTIKIEKNIKEKIPRPKKSIICECGAVIIGGPYRLGLHKITKLHIKKMTSVDTQGVLPDTQGGL